MSILNVFLAVFIYIAIGGILSGFCHDEDYIVWYTSFWPVIIVYFILMAIGYLFYQLGEKLSDLFKKEKKHEN